MRIFGERGRKGLKEEPKKCGHGQTVVELKEVAVNFEKGSSRVEAVKDVNLQVQRGEVVGIVGRSGAGKSTLVRTLNHLTCPSQGQVLIHGQDLAKLEPKELLKTRRSIGMIFQHFNLLNSKTVADNIGLALKDFNKAEKRARIEKLLQLVGIPEKIHSYPRELSGGQKQRVAIARALANDPDLLLCDEATSALDPEATQAILQLLKQLNEELGLTLIVITHEMQVVKELCQRVVVMEKGEIIEEGSLVEVFARPKTALTRDLVARASHLAEDRRRILDHPEKLNPEGGPLYELTYVGEEYNVALVASLQRNFKVTASILSADVELLGDIPVGHLLLRLAGEDAKIQEGLAYWQAQGVGIAKVFHPRGKHQDGNEGRKLKETVREEISSKEVS